jgi:hypothetical protein
MFLNHGSYGFISKDYEKADSTGILLMEYECVVSSKLPTNVLDLLVRT